MAVNQELAVVLRLVATQFQSELNRSQGALGRFTKMVTDMRVILLAATAAIAGIVKTTANYGDELAKNSQRIGVNIEALAGLQFAAQIAGSTSEDLIKALGQLSKNLFDISLGTGEAIRAFDELGISALDQNDRLRESDEVLFDIADKFAKMPNSTLKTAAAMQIFGKAGKELIPLLNLGSSGMRELMDEARKLGLVMSLEDAQAAEAFNDSLTRLGAAAIGLRNKIGVELFGSFEALANILTDLASGPVGSAITKLFQGWAAIATIANANIKSLMATVRIITRFGFSEFSRDLSIETEKRIKEDLERDLRLIFEGFAKGAEGPPIPRPGTEIAGTREGETKRLNAEKKVVDTILEVRRKSAQANLDIEAERINQTRRLGEASNAELLSLEEVLASKRTQVQLRFLKDRIGNERDFIADLRDIGFKTALDKEAAENASQDKVLKLEGEIVLTKKKANREVTKFVTENLLEQRRLEVERGEFARDMTTSEVAIRKRANDQILKDRVEMARALLEAGELNLEGLKQLAVRRRQVLEAEQALELSSQDLTESQRLAIITRFTARIDRERRIEVGGFVEGFREGLVRYSNDLDSAFGLARDMARETAVAMQRAFQTFFFDLFEGKIRSMKDVLVGFLNFVKQIIASVLAQLAATQLAGFIGTFVGAVAGAGAAGGGAGAPTQASGGNVAIVHRGGPIQKFQFGGATFSNTDRIPAILRQGEFVLTPKGVDVLTRANQGQGPLRGEEKITVNVVNSGREDKPRVNVRRQVKELVLDIIFRDVGANGNLRGLLQG